MIGAITACLRYGLVLEMLWDGMDIADELSRRPQGISRTPCPEAVCWVVVPRLTTSCTSVVLDRTTMGGKLWATKVGDGKACFRASHYLDHRIHSSLTQPRYFRKHQTLDLPQQAPADAQFMPHAAKDKYHGTSGPIHTSFNDHYMPMEEDFCKAAFEVGGSPNKLHDAWSGDHYGFYSSLGAVDRTNDKGNRSYAATGYLKPNLGRGNLRVLVDAHAARILLKDQDGREPVAEGVEFLHGEAKYTVHASREVILSGGVIGTPQLLELSGIGDPAVLEKAGIECKVKNEKVGANFQDHVLGGMLFDLKDGVKSMDELHNEEYAKAQQKIYDETQQGPYGSPGMLMGFVSYSSIVDQQTLDTTIADIRKNSLAKTEFEKAQEKVIVDQLTDPTFANIQTFCIPCRLDLSAGSSQIQFFSAPPKGVNQVSLLVCLEHPLSRGSVHITSADPMAHPRIDPGYFRNEADLKIMAAGIAWMDKVSRHPLMQESLGKRVQPAEDYSLETEQERMDYVRNHVSTQYHLIGTASMGQVVDDRLKVIGVRGLRVVDASVFPGHVSGNIMSTTYAVAEKGADIIKADDGRYDLSRVDSAVH